jgi:LysR family transcriptional regulator, glycine cleavage system transcriptional activator
MSGTLPPLNSLKAFEVAGRHGSFVLAGHELGVTPAAVSQLVRKLEAHLGKKLFQRFNNRIVLTDAGKALFAGTSPAMAELSEAVARVSRGTQPRKLRFSVVPSLAECWLLPLLPGFLSEHPRIRLALSVEETATHNSFDLRLNYGRMPNDDLVQDELWRDEVLPLCAPAFLVQHGGQVNFASTVASQLIHTQWGASFASNATWRDWFHAFAPGTRIDMGKGHDVDASRTALQLAELGVGIALGQRLMAQQSLHSGTLVSASPHALPLGQSYIVATPLARNRQPDVQVFRTWLLEQVRNPAANPPPHRTAIPTH